MAEKLVGVRVRCPDCGHELLLTTSDLPAETRIFCSSGFDFGPWKAFRQEPSEEDPFPG
jgi:hypothetical protein